MESVEVSAKNVDEAIDIALDELGLKRSQVEIEILSAGKPGLFGIGGEPARVRVTALEEGTARPMAEPEDMDFQAPGGPVAADVELADLDSPEVELATEYLTRFLGLMEIPSEVTVRVPETPGDGLGRVSAVLDVEGEDLGLLIGRRGTTLSALQYMVNLMVSRQKSSRVLVSVDVEHYRRRREDSLYSLAQRMAERVSRSGRSMTLEPMPPGERRIIHLALSEDQGVTTGSVGEGDHRKVVIHPSRGGR
ncbi:MAG: RNA-binding cell elongation regulator Jag/EloR [Dehalococcoidia bacterium]